MAFPDLPHFAAPFSFAADGTAVVVEQDSVEDVQACIYNIAVCPLGFRGDLPAFGVPELAFSPVPIDTAGLQAALRRWEPRADLAVAEHADAADQARRTITAQVGVRD